MGWGVFAPVMILAETLFEGKVENICQKTSNDKISNHTATHHHPPPSTHPSLFLHLKGLRGAWVA